MGCWTITNSVATISSIECANMQQAPKNCKKISYTIYRTNSLLLNISKLREKCINVSHNSYVEENHLIHDFNVICKISPPMKLYDIIINIRYIINKYQPPIQINYSIGVNIEFDTLLNFYCAYVYPTMSYNIINCDKPMRIKEIS